MSSFDIAHKKTAGNEGGYANNPHDAGGETFAGIARKFWPKWAGWQGIDAAKKKLLPPPPYGSREYRNWVKNFDGILKTSPLLQKYVDEFYKVNFWDAYRLGEIQNQAVADWAFDHVVNAGARGAKWLQEAAGVKADGVVGLVTLKAVNGADPVSLLRRMKEVAGAYRLKRIAADPTQRQFAHSWLSRDGYSEEEIKEILA